MQPRLLLLPFLLSSLPALAVTFQTRLESVEWKVEGDQFECRLSQPVANFGVGEFVRRAGEQATFRLKPEAQWLGRGSATLLAAAPPWRPGQGDINLGQVSIGSGEVPFNSSQQQAGRLLTGLLEGRSPLVRHRTWQGDRLEVRLLPARFASVYSQYQACIAKLLPVNFDQVKLAQVGFPDGGTALNDVARAKLDIILQLLKADPSINRIELDGHSDNSGNRLTNRDLSRRRALAVQEYLKSNGCRKARSTCASTASATRWWPTTAPPTVRATAGSPCTCRARRWSSRRRKRRRPRTSRRRPRQNLPHRSLRPPRFRENPRFESRKR